MLKGTLSFKKKAENKKEKEKAMWKKLDELNKRFKDIKEKEKVEEKKMSATIIHYFFIKCVCFSLDSVTVT